MRTSRSERHSYTQHIWTRPVILQCCFATTNVGRFRSLVFILRRDNFKCGLLSDHPVLHHVVGPMDFSIVYEARIGLYYQVVRYGWCFMHYIKFMSEERMERIGKSKVTLKAKGFVVFPKIMGQKESPLKNNTEILIICVHNKTD